MGSNVFLYTCIPLLVLIPCLRQFVLFLFVSVTQMKTVMDLWPMPAAHQLKAPPARRQTLTKTLIQTPPQYRRRRAKWSPNPRWHYDLVGRRTLSLYGCRMNRWFDWIRQGANQCEPQCESLRNGTRCTALPHYTRLYSLDVWTAFIRLVSEVVSSLLIRHVTYRSS